METRDQTMEKVRRLISQAAEATDTACQVVNTIQARSERVEVHRCLMEAMRWLKGAEENTH